MQTSPVPIRSLEIKRNFLRGSSVLSPPKISSYVRFFYHSRGQVGQGVGGTNPELFLAGPEHGFEAKGCLDISFVSGFCYVMATAELATLLYRLNILSEVKLVS